jgi:hypothetical protein
MHVVALVLEPTENDRSIKTAGVSEYAARHREDSGFGGQEQKFLTTKAQRTPREGTRRKTF